MRLGPRRFDDATNINGVTYVRSSTYRPNTYQGPLAHGGCEDVGERPLKKFQSASITTIHHNMGHGGAEKIVPRTP